MTPPRPMPSRRAPSRRARVAVVILSAVVTGIASGPARAQNAPPGAFADAARRAVAAANAGPGRQVALRRLYAGDDPRPLWSADGRPTAQALALIPLLRDAADRGLDPRDYDADELADAARLLDASADSARLARFDVALSRSAVLLLGDLHMGRANPRALGFDLPDTHRGLDLAALALAVSRAPDPALAVARAEPPHVGYAALGAALARYRALAADASLAPPAPAAGRKALRPGDPYPGAPVLRRLLVALGDLAPEGAAADSGAAERQYTPALSAAATAFQRRHGLVADGVAGPATMAALRVPLARRVRQIELTLERWRWLPDTLPARYAVVNVPAFRLFLFEDDPAAAHPVLRMNVIVGQAADRRGTPVFTGTMQQVVFRPYWDVPPSIARKEVIPDIRRKPGYFDREELEIVRGGDVGAVVYPLTDANLGRVLRGTLRIRQRPGPKNSLGLVKFVFPNDYSVYLHGTPAQQLFAETRRDFSHGCIRVEDPTALAEAVLRGQDGWDRAAIEGAMAGDRTLRLTIARPIAVYVLYATAVVGDDGAVRFFPDLYGRDAVLDRALAARSRDRARLDAPAALRTPAR